MSLFLYLQLVDLLALVRVAASRPVQDLAAHAEVRPTAEAGLVKVAPLWRPQLQWKTALHDAFGMWQLLLFAGESLA